MNEDKLTKSLQQGKAESAAFFSHVEEDVLRAAVKHRLEKPEKRGQKLAVRLCAIAACAVVAVCVWAGAVPVPGGGGETGAYLPAANGQEVQEGDGNVLHAGAERAGIEPVASQAVALDGGDYSVSFHPVSVPQEEQPGLMSILWQDVAGKAEMIYSSLFEQSDQPYPASVVGFPGETGDKILLLSTGSSTGNYLHYRLVRYSGGGFDTVWSQDYVPQGRLGVQDGVVVEQRQEQAARLSYIVPVLVDAGGEVYLPVDTLHLHTGDTVVLVGGGLDAVSQNGAALPAEGREEASMFVADAAGSDVLSFGETGKELALDITE